MEQGIVGDELASNPCDCAARSDALPPFTPSLSPNSVRDLPVLEDSL